ncbi:unnamed protein product [Schistosoma mattheei]|uniref:Uncharacterized protein n=1 Tax=Schistosoma mattheei TaxID=31246 RepID=A0A183PUX2_9TREM|nr:unnamed protein product [Schistosoma mattheei]
MQVKSHMSDIHTVSSLAKTSCSVSELAVYSVTFLKAIGTVSFSLLEMKKHVAPTS